MIIIRSHCIQTAKETTKEEFMLTLEKVFHVTFSNNEWSLEVKSADFKVQHFQSVCVCLCVYH